MQTGEQGYIIEAQGLLVLEELTEQQWRAIGKDLMSRDMSIQWALGDWIAQTRGEWGDRYRLAVDVTGYSYEHVQQLYATAAAWPKAARIPTLTWSHHRVLASVQADERRSWVQEVKAQKWSAISLQEALVRERSKHRPPERTERLTRARPTIKNHVKCPSCGHVFAIRGHRTGSEDQPKPRRGRTQSA